MPISLLAIIFIAIVNYIILPIIYQMILIGFRAMLPLIKTAMLNYVIPYLENRVQDSFINNTFFANYREWFSPIETLKLY